MAMVRSLARARGRLGALAVAAGALLVAGCTSAQLVNVWKDPDYSGGPLRHVLVVSQRPDPTVRRLWEDALVARLDKQGIEAVPSYRAFPDAPPSKARLADAIADQHLEGALIVRRLQATTETHWVPGYATLTPRAYYDPWGRGDYIVTRRRFHRGYAVVDRIDREQVSLWSGQGGGRMVWAGTVEAENPGPADSYSADFARGLVLELKRAQLF